MFRKARRIERRPVASTGVGSVCIPPFYHLDETRSMASPPVRVEGLAELDAALLELGKGLDQARERL